MQGPCSRAEPQLSGGVEDGVETTGGRDGRRPNDAGMQERGEKKGDGGKQARREEDRRGKKKNRKPLSFININPQERNSNRQKPPSDRRPHKTQGRIENRAVPGKISTERQKPWGKCEFKGWDSREHKDMRRGLVTELKTNGDLRCRQIERHALVVAVPERDQHAQSSRV